MEEQGDPLERDYALAVVLPGGVERNATVHGSQAVMDLMVALCARYHLNPPEHTVELLSPNKNHISFKANSPIGSLDAHTVVLKPKAAEEKIRATYTPEVSVRLLINYRRSHKAVLRVDPGVPLQLLLPAVCHKCEFGLETTVLLRDGEALEPLDLSRSLNHHGLRELYARDTVDVTVGTDASPELLRSMGGDTAAPPQGCTQDTLIPKKRKKQKENKGFLSLFRRRKNKDTSSSAPASPELKQKPAGSVGSLLGEESPDHVPADMPKKRRAPPPPALETSQSVPHNLSLHHLHQPQSSTESTLQRTKRRAPPPPPAVNSHFAPPAEAEVKETSIEEEQKDENVPSDSDRTPPPQHQQPTSPPPTSSTQPVPPLQERNPPYLTPCRGKGPSHVRSVLAEILTSSLSGRTVVNRLSSPTFPKIYSRSSSFTLATPKCPEGRGSGAESTGSDWDLNRPAESEPNWEDPAMKKGMTTFKVVPSKKTSCEVELASDLPERSDIQEHLDLQEQLVHREDSRSSEDNESSVENETGTPESPEPERSMPDPERCPVGDQVFDSPSPPPLPSNPGSQGCSPTAEEDRETSEEVEGSLPSEDPISPPRGTSPDHSVERPAPDGSQSTGFESPSHQSPDDQETDQPEANERIMHEDGVLQEEEEQFPPPPPPVFYNEHTEEAEEEGATEESFETPSSPASNGAALTLGGPPDHQKTSTDPDPHLAFSAPAKPLKRMSTVPSRFAQAVALAVQRARSQSQGGSFRPHDWNNPNTSKLPSPPRPHANTVPEWLPHSTLNDGSCLG